MLLLFLSGCASQKESILPNLTVIDIPKLYEERSSEIGETLVEKGKVYTYDGIILENSLHAGDGIFLKKLTLDPGQLPATMQDTKAIYYSTNKLKVYDALLGTKMEYGGLAINRTNEKDINFHLNGKKVMRPDPAPVYTKTKIKAIDRPSYRQELIYNGKINNYLKFLYREYTSDVMRAPFSQDIQYDLKDGNVIGFKGVRIQVIEATNTKIKYKVLASFPDSL